MHPERPKCNRGAALAAFLAWKARPSWSLAAAFQPLEWRTLKKERDVKKTDLEKLKGTKIAGNQKLASIPDRFGKDAGTQPDKREQRRRDAELGLIPFAVKLPSDLVKRLRDRAEADNVSLNELTADLIGKALGKKA
jgi:hypothetical protein